MPPVLRVAFFVVSCAVAHPAPAAQPALPPGMAAALQRSGVPLRHFGVYVQPVDADTPAPLAALNAEQPFLLASTAKLVTSLAALRLLGSNHRWPSLAHATAPVVGGRLQGDLVITGGDAGLTPDELRRWFRQMRDEGLDDVSGRIVLDGVALLQDPPSPAAAEGGGEAPAQAGGARRLVVQVQPGDGARAAVRLHPAPAGVQLVNDVAMGGGCSVYARWKPMPGAGAPTVWVSGRWDRRCGRRDAATLQAAAGLAVAPRSAVAPSAPATVAALWREAGGRLRGRVVEQPLAAPAPAGSAPAWRSQLWTSLPQRLRDINKPSLNSGAQRLLLALSGRRDDAALALRGAQQRLAAWLHDEGLAADDLHIEIGSGQSRNERGRPRAMVQLLHAAWRHGDSQGLFDSLPVAGVDGTLAHRLRQGAASGRAWLKTGTLRDTRALAGYVVGRSGRVYAVALVVNHPQAARATPALDALVEWVARNG